MNEHMDFLRGKTAIITGAAGGIGEALCHKIAGYGMNLVMVGRNAQKLTALAAEMEAENVQTEVCIGDLSSLDFIDQVIERACMRFGSVDVLVNNAGITHNCPMGEMTPQLFDSVMQINVRAPYFMCQRALPELKKSDCATIINICSVVAHKGYVNQSAYAASKHALLGLSKTLANEVYKEGIRVHVISPGGVFTPMVAIARPDLSPEGMMLPRDIANIAGFYLEMRRSDAVVDEIQAHRSNKEPFA